MTPNGNYLAGGIPSRVAAALLTLAAAGCVASTDASEAPGQSSGIHGGGNGDGMGQPMGGTAAFGGMGVATGGGVPLPTGGTAGSSTGGTGNVAPAGGGGNVGPTGGSGNTPPIGGSGNVPPTGGTGNVFVTGGSGGLGFGGSPSGGTGNAFDAGSAPDRNRVQAGQVCDRLATIQCAGEVACCDNPGRTFDQCKVAQMSECQNDFFLDSVSMNSVSGYSVDAAEAAFTTFENLASQCDPTIASWSISPSGLRGITQGTVGAGGDCTPPLSFNTADAAAQLVACTDGANQACLPGGAIPGTPWTCTPRAAAGQRCFTDLNCIDGHYCPNFGNPPSLSGDNCAARKTNGSPCAYSQECQSLTCVAGSCTEATTQTAYCLM